MTELLRALATLTEPPTDEAPLLARLLGFSRAPTSVEYTELFVLQQVPYASVYLGETGMIGGEAQDRVGGFWRALGVSVPSEPDHLAAMLGGYASLCDASSQVSSARGRDALARARTTFLWEHLLSWLPGYLQAVQRSRVATYKRWAWLLLSALIEEAQRLPCAAPLPHFLQGVAPVADPRSDGLTPFIASLLAPARSGIILTRTDLARIARSLDIGLSIQNRKAGLRTLLTNAPHAALVWIAVEARRSCRLHYRLQAQTGQLAEFWAGRAGATATLADDLSRDVAKSFGVPTPFPSEAV